MGGALGGRSTQSTQLPAWLESASQAAIGQAQDASSIGYVPWQGPDVAAMTGGQLAAIEGNNQALDAFGMPTAQTSGMPQAQDFGGISGYSSFPMYEQALASLQQSNPAQYAALTGMFMDPTTGRMPSQQVAPQQPVFRDDSGGNRSTGSAPRQSSSQGGGYTGILDMVNGGGPGASGDTFQGGGILSSYGNFRTRPLGQR